MKHSVDDDGDKGIILMIYDRGIWVFWYKIQLGQIGDCALFVQVEIGDPILSNSNSPVIFLSFSLYYFVLSIYYILFVSKYLKIIYITKRYSTYIYSLSHAQLKE